MKLENVLLIGGLAFLTYWLIKKNPKIIDVSDNNTNNEPKTIVLNLNQVKGKPDVLSSKVERRFNAHEFATVSPAMVEVGALRSNFYDF